MKNLLFAVRSGQWGRGKNCWTGERVVDDRNAVQVLPAKFVKVPPSENLLIKMNFKFSLQNSRDVIFGMYTLDKKANFD